MTATMTHCEPSPLRQYLRSHRLGTPARMIVRICNGTVTEARHSEFNNFGFCHDTASVDMLMELCELADFFLLRTTEGEER